VRQPGQPPPIAYPDAEQAREFHLELARRMGATDWGPINEAKLKSSLDRARDTLQHQRGDIITMAAFMFFGLVRDAPFGKGSTETGLALTLAFLLRHGIAIDAEDEEIAGITLGMADGQVFAGMVEMWMREYIGRGMF
jgi:prophage maintenance system killer protein